MGPSEKALTGVLVAVYGPERPDGRKAPAQGGERAKGREDGG